MILDGWALAPPGPGNAVELARTPVFDELWSTYPHGTLTTFGRAVGLPDTQMGNSEVGHLTPGWGQVVRQDLTRIDDAIDDGSFFDDPALNGACAGARQSGRLHLLGLVSPGGVHASMKHLLACIQLAGRERVPERLGAFRRIPRRCSSRAPSRPVADGTLANVAPTVLELLGVEPPTGMRDR